MKRVLSALLAGVIVIGIGCTENNSKSTDSSRTTIQGVINGGDGEMLFLNKINKRKIGVIFDTILIGEGGTFSHTIKDPLKLDYYVITNNKRNQVFLITDSTEQITFNADFNAINRPTEIVGSPHTEVYLELFEKVSDHQKSTLAIENRIKLAKDIEEKIVIGKEKRIAKEEFKTNLELFVKENSSSPGIAAFFDAMDFTQDLKLSGSIINNLAKVVPYSNYYKARESNVMDFTRASNSKSQNSDKGKVAPNIELDDPDGVKKTLYELRGKVVLIDFWASWCGPCRRENPNVVKAYNKYHDQGFEVFSVSLDDNKDKWIAAIEKDGLIWDYHVSDLKKWNTPYKSIYKFSGIPHTVLVDRHGNIVDTKVRGAALEDKLETLFGY